MEQRSYPITVYTKPSCMPCRMTKRQSSQSGVPFLERDVSADPAAAQAVRDLGYAGVPVVTVQMEDGTDHWHGHKPDSLAAAIYLHHNPLAG